MWSSGWLTAQDKNQSDVQVQFNQLVAKGDLVGGQEPLKKLLIEKPENAQARLALGATQFIRAIERLAQSLYKYGARNNGSRAAHTAVACSRKCKPSSGSV